MRSLQPIIVACFLFPACTTTIPVRVDEPLNNDRIFNFEQVNSRFERSVAVVNLVHGKTISAYDLHVAADTVRFSDLDSSLSYSVATRDVISIERKDHLTGVITGAGLGTLAGAAVGLTVVFSHPGSSSTDGMGAGLVFVGFTGIGTVFGIGIGVLQGNTEKYQFQPDISRTTDSTYTVIGRK